MSWPNLRGNQSLYRETLHCCDRSALPHPIHVVGSSTAIQNSASFTRMRFRDAVVIILMSCLQWHRSCLRCGCAMVERYFVQNLISLRQLLHLTWCIILSVLETKTLKKPCRGFLADIEKENDKVITSYVKS